MNEPGLHYHSYTDEQQRRQVAWFWSPDYKEVTKELTKSHPARGLPTAALRVCALVKLYLEFLTF
jgi:hypothetical protein